MIQIAEERFDTVEANQDLIVEHWNEIVKDDSGRVLNVDWATFRMFEHFGRLVTIVAREDGEVAGYAVFILQPHFHAKDSICAHNDALFLRKQSRKGRAGILLIREAEKLLRAKGIHLVLWHVKPTVDFSSVLLRYGYQLHETIYAKRLG